MCQNLKTSDRRRLASCKNVNCEFGIQTGTSVPKTLEHGTLKNTSIAGVVASSSPPPTNPSGRAVAHFLYLLLSFLSTAAAC